MIGTLLKLGAYAVAPRATFAVRHPVRNLRLRSTARGLRHGYSARLAAIATAAVVGPLAYRVGKRIGSGALDD
jgi:hypothetical protein